MSDFSERLKVVIDRHTARKVAAWLGVSTRSLSFYENGERHPKSNKLELLCRETGISPSWLLLGVGPMLISQPSALKESEKNNVDTVAIPKVKARLSAGTGSLETSGDSDTFCYFRSDWINRKCRPGQCVVMDVGGDSMDPVIKDKDIVLVDQGQTDIITGNIYAIGIDDEVLIKHVDKVPGHYVLRSANKDYAPINVDLNDESLNVRIIGRVLWMGREL
ncbi:MAG: hypothetical protein CL942_00160 [Desulfovibrio sp.]|nr:hypothetical protein [Desulfovibrio sp.]|tara:strand:- start:421 stop:1080 length:660 start_codon:yes stop_codon:yes gene_type:complete